MGGVGEGGIGDVGQTPDFAFGSTKQERATLGPSAFSKQNIFPSKCGPDDRPVLRVKKQQPQPSFNHLINTFE